MLSAKKIAAGKGGQIEAAIKTNDLTGPVEKRIVIETNDPGNPNVALTIKAIVEPEIKISDSQITFEDAPAGREIAKEITLILPVSKPIKVLSAVSRTPDIVAKLDPVPGGNGEKWKLTAVHKANAKPGYFFGQIVVKTDSRLTPELSIYVRGLTLLAKK